jgi:hypothetical protein
VAPAVSNHRDAEALPGVACSNLLVLLGFTEGLSGYETREDASDSREGREHNLNMSLLNSVGEPVQDDDYQESNSGCAQDKNKGLDDPPPYLVERRLRGPERLRKSPLRRGVSFLHPLSKNLHLRVSVGGCLHRFSSRNFLDLERCAAYCMANKVFCIPVFLGGVQRFLEDSLLDLDGNAIHLIDKLVVCLLVAPILCTRTISNGTIFNGTVRHHSPSAAVILWLA